MTLYHYRQVQDLIQYLLMGSILFQPRRIGLVVACRTTDLRVPSSSPVSGTILFRGVEYHLEYPDAGHLRISLFAKTRSCIDAETPRFSGIRGWIL